METRTITVKEAQSLLIDSEDIHTFRQSGMMIMGCDRNKANLIETMKEYKDTLQLTGEQARSMKHGIALFDDRGALFIETCEEKLNIFDPQ